MIDAKCLSGEAGAEEGILSERNCCLGAAADGERWDWAYERWS